MAILSLKEAYEKNTLKYLCNSCGEVFDPEDSRPEQLCVAEPEKIMNAKELVLYQQYWEEGLGCQMYVMRVKGEPAIGLGYLFDEGWCEELIAKKVKQNLPVTADQMKECWMPRLYQAVNDAAQELIGNMVPGCDIYLGNMTDPDGHEMVIIVPYDKRENVRSIADQLYETLYQTVEELF